MKAVVMAGGEGSRLRPLTSQRPKPLVPVAGRPIMEHILLLLRQHQVRDVIATVQYLGASIRNYFGDGSAVQRFLEKPSWGEVFSDLANTGIYVLDPAVFEYFKAGEVVDWSGDVFPKLLEDGRPIFGWVADGYWEDVGGHTAYMKANFDALEGKVRVDVPGMQIRPGVWVAEDAEIAEDARIDGPAYIGAGTKLRHGIWLNGPCVVGNYTTVDHNSKVSNSIIWDHSYVGENCRLRGSVV